MLTRIATRELALYSLRQKMYSGILNEGQIVSNTYDVIRGNHLNLEIFYVSIFTICFIYSIIDRSRKKSFDKLRHFGISREMEKNVEFFFYVFCMIMTKNVENAI
jgi:hypothetical protein